MKIPKTEFKAIIKECLKELVAEGALDHMVSGMVNERAVTIQQQAVMQDPRVMAAAMQSAGGNPQQAHLMQQIFADTAVNSLPQHMRNEVPGGGMGVNLSMINEQPLAPSTGYLPQRNPLPPRDAVQQMVAGPQASANTRWANLAFNSPISNRPGGSTTGGAGFLPGSKKGNFE